jgi:hypothetical protein
LCAHNSRNVYFGDGNASLEFIPVENCALAHVLAVDALMREGESRKKLSQQTYFIGNGEDYTYGWFMGKKGTEDCYGDKKKKDGGDMKEAAEDGGQPLLSHWQQPHPEPFSLRLAKVLCYINEWWDGFSGHSFLPRWWVPDHLYMTQVTFTCNCTKAAQDFSFEPVLTVADSVRRIARQCRLQAVDTGSEQKRVQ